MPTVPTMKPDNRRMTAAEVIYTALVWAEESMAQMVHGCGPDSEHGRHIADEIKQLRAYRVRRFGKERSPFEGSKLMSLDELSKLPRHDDAGK